MLNCHQEFGFLWSDLVVLFLKVDSWRKLGSLTNAATYSAVCLQKA